METNHKIYFQNCMKMDEVEDNSIDLVVTSPPYPMIEMWDGIFSMQNKLIESALKKGLGLKAFSLMHELLEPVWRSLFRVVKKGGFVCINVGDATRTINGDFMLYPNHIKIIDSMINAGFSVLPCILWRKQTNAPNKFMGSGMLPAGAYVTLEHEYILIFRKGPKREFKNENDKKARRKSAFFWEERNVWFSDIWFDIKGTVQTLNDKETRKRSAAYPFELAYRLINMYSAKGDIVLDPFLGTGTTMGAAITSGRNSLGYEFTSTLKETIHSYIDRVVDHSNQYITERIKKHISFIEKRIGQNKPVKYINSFYNFPVITKQEQDILLNEIKALEKVEDNIFHIIYHDNPQRDFVCGRRNTFLNKSKENCNNFEKLSKHPFNKSPATGDQLTLFN